MKPMKTRYVIESRNADGSLKLDGPQPESVFGLAAIQGLDDWRMSRVIFARIPDATLDGGHIATWPALLNPHWIARRKTW